MPRFKITDAEGRVILTDKQIATYEWATHTMTLEPRVILTVRDEDERNLVCGIPFSVVADSVSCYKGKVTTSFSSFSQSCPVIDRDPIDGKEGLVRIQLGYPSRDYFRGEDPRGDDRVRKSLLSLGKLRE